MKVIGLMSGTSADGIDAVLAEITDTDGKISVRQEKFLFTPFKDSVREAIIRIANNEVRDTGEICAMNFLLGQLYADACEDLCKEAGVSPKEIDLVGCHGQTIWHMPKPQKYLGHNITGTLQIGEAAVIAERLGCRVINDFRVRDMAAGGLGAPLVPYAEYFLFKTSDKNLALQNIGGIGNVTILPGDCSIDDVIAFDTGPGNMLIDNLVVRMTESKKSYDAGGELASKGSINGELLSFLMADEYLDLKPPKTTGREHYNSEYVDRLIFYAKERGISDSDILRTVTRYTPETIAHSLCKCVGYRPDELIVSGGGSKNLVIMQDLQDLLPETKVMTSEDYGYDSDAKEALAFAVLAYEAANGRTNNVPTATGATHPVIMGKISY